MRHASQRPSVSRARRLVGWALQVLGTLLVLLGFGLAITLVGACATPLLLLLGVLCVSGGAFVRNPPPDPPLDPPPPPGGGDGEGERVLPWRPRTSAEGAAVDRLAA